MFTCRELVLIHVYVKHLQLNKNGAKLLHYDKIIFPQNSFYY